MEYSIQDIIDATVEGEPVKVQATLITSLVRRLWTL